MTRFARAKGSKASNERTAEEGTPWHEMKKQLLEKNKEMENSKQIQEINEKRQANYNEFLEEIETDKCKDTKWAEFPGVEKVKNKIKSKKLKKDKLLLGVGTEELENGKKKLNKQINKKLVDCEDNKLTNKEQSNKIIKNFDEEKIEKKKSKKSKKLTSKDQTLLEVDSINVNNNVVEKKKSKKRKFDQQNEVESENQQESVVETNKKKTKSKKIKSNKNANLKLEETNSDKVINNKDLEKKDLSETDLKKIEYKKEKKLRQLEKKKLRKAEQTPKTNQNSQTKSSNQKSNVKKTVRDNKIHERKKPEQNSLRINGEDIEITYFDGFPLKKDDAERLKTLRKQLISKGLPRSEIQKSLKLERRRAEKVFTKEKKKLCYNCRQSGHVLSECPNIISNNQLTSSEGGVEICFKCGSTEHRSLECKVVKGDSFRYATCFVCNEQGHLARQCPDNARGLYPNGGACRLCGDVTHLKKDCPKYQIEQKQHNFYAETFNSSQNPDGLEDEGGDSFSNKKTNFNSKPNKIIKF